METVKYIQRYTQPLNTEQTLSLFLVLLIHVAQINGDPRPYLTDSVWLGDLGSVAVSHQGMEDEEQTLQVVGGLTLLINIGLIQVP